MGEPYALDSDEAPFWRSLMRITTALPRALEDQFLPETGLAITDYGVQISRLPRTGCSPSKKSSA